ncbi:vanadium-dependent haloperoxidase [Flavihumibacter solisilvae]|uniref:Phosphatidic acid phosphatase type 2/haloperoxidase domain-containing protein n=1 Tax=Flavihumibacter solisilvae TaxID=1349421 RepID=A0A0C1KY48_9BACT|nr:vanadium-dependent haloperoxidase [Flavihumibacter solisilvae]KIC92622.1 hypothetical protein OI18_21825 [Flavihumibacter solisilvae]
MRQKRNLLLLFIAAIVITMAGCEKVNLYKHHGKGGHFADVLPNDEIIKWSNVAFDAAGGPAEGHPALAARIAAMMHIAMHDALNAIVPVYEQYSYHQEYALANPFAATASAAHTVLKASWPDYGATLDAKLTESLSGIPDGTAKTQGIALGIASGNAILEMRDGDGAFQNPLADWPASTVPGVYIEVPPFDVVYAPFWGSIPAFSLQANDQFRSSPPPDLGSPLYTEDFEEVKEVGIINSTTRTADQTAYAHWWFELSDIGWNRITRIQATEHSTGLYQTARLFALVNIAMADAYIACWEAKYYYNFWRPYTAIRAAATDGNDNTTPDPNWEPLIATPPVPDYPSGHATVANAAATVLTHFFGNQSPFSMTSTTAVPEGAIRSFETFKQAADENADSRVVVGIHFRFACEAGQEMGNNVGKWTIKNHLQPVH